MTNYPNKEKLWDDLTDSFENEDSHFLGSVILKQIGSSMGSERLVIDGQQRLTTYSIFLKTIMDIVGKENLPDLLIPYASIGTHSFVLGRTETASEKRCHQ